MSDQRLSVRSRHLLTRPTNAVLSVTRRQDPAALGPRERAVLAVLIERRGRLIDRSTLRHDAGIEHLSVRRCDSLLVAIRRVLGNDSVLTVRGRGWRLNPDSIAAAHALVSDAAADNGERRRAV